MEGNRYNRYHDGIVFHLMNQNLVVYDWARFGVKSPEELCALIVGFMCGKKEKSEDETKNLCYRCVFWKPAKLFSTLASLMWK